MKRIFTLTILTLVATQTMGCASMRHLLGLEVDEEQSKLIENPFNDFNQSENDKANAVVLRTKKGDRAVEVEFPGRNHEFTNVEIPVLPGFKDRQPASSAGGIDQSYKLKRPTLSDHEIKEKFPRGNPKTNWRLKEIEEDLGLKASKDQNHDNTNYLAGLDVIKQLFKNNRFEAALIETDTLLQQYPTNPKLYEMRGTLLERLGQFDLAVSSWKQSLKFDPSNQALKRYMDRKISKNQWKEGGGVQ